MGVLITLDAANNFPHLPIRTDGPYLVGLGRLKGQRDIGAGIDSSGREFDTVSHCLPTSFCRGIMAEHEEFYRRTDKEGHSICLSCFQSVKAA
jgi:hypothetical protein